MKLHYLEIKDNIEDEYEEAGSSVNVYYMGWGYAKIEVFNVCKTPGMGTRQVDKVNCKKCQIRLRGIDVT